MAYCVLSGKLLDMVGKPLAKATFKFTSSSNSTSIINAVDTVITTDSNGLYYSNLAYGTYTISFRGATDANYKVIAKNIVIGVLGPVPFTWAPPHRLLLMLMRKQKWGLYRQKC